MKLPSRRSLWILGVILIAYIGSYSYLAYRGIPDYRQYGVKGFMYCRSDALFSRDPDERRSAGRFHDFCCYFFAPVRFAHGQFDGRAYLAWGPGDCPFANH